MDGSPTRVWARIPHKLTNYRPSSKQDGYCMQLEYAPFAAKHRTRRGQHCQTEDGSNKVESVYSKRCIGDHIPFMCLVKLKRCEMWQSKD